MTPTAIPPRILDALRTDVRAGRSCIVTYDHPDGVGWLDVFGPEGMRGGADDGAFTAPIPTVRLWQPGGGTAPLAEAVANRGGRRHFCRVQIDETGRVRSAGQQASHALNSLANANGLLDLPVAAELATGTPVQVLRW